MTETSSGDINPPVTPDRLLQFGFGFAPVLIVDAAIENRVFDTLDTGPKSVAEVSQETGASQRGLRILMNALIGLDLLRKDGAGKYSLTAESAAFLVRGKREFLGGMARHTAGQLVPDWLELPEVVRTGKPATSAQRRSRGPDYFVKFVEGLFPMHYQSALALGEALSMVDWPAPVRILDIAAGSGAWGIGLAQKAPGSEVAMVDFPEVLQIAKRIAEQHGMEGRLKYLAGDMLEVEYGTGYQVAVLGQILHACGERDNRALLTKVFDALAPRGIVAVADRFPSQDRTGPPSALIFAVNMLVNTEAGDTFTFGEVAGWLRDAGFAEPRMLEIEHGSPLIVATKPG